MRDNKFLTSEKGELVLSKQVLRCGASISANVEEAVGALLKADFISKLLIAYALSYPCNQRKSNKVSRRITQHNWTHSAISKAILIFTIAYRNS
ncbi:four helix bundle protein [Daejeonella lutea]|uniref:four helix bundle protein n=1 Tax=Daejeonella lutea TaxID=572036 RepID=UPI001482276E|nr:four helix bundle protein [Daejeonella lutea]